VRHRPPDCAAPIALPDPEGVDAERLLAWIWLRAWLELLEDSVDRTADTSVALVRDLPRRWWQREGPPGGRPDTAHTPTGSDAAHV
jgi:hypothetical protein